MFLTNIFSNLIKGINKYIKNSKTLIPFVQSPYQNWTDLGRLGEWTKGFTVYVLEKAEISIDEDDGYNYEEIKDSDEEDVYIKQSEIEDTLLIEYSLQVTIF